GALLMVLGSSIGGPWWVAVLTLTLATFIGGILSVYGMGVAQVGIILTILFAMALGRDGGPAVAVPTALGFLSGGAFFLLLVLVSSLLRQSPHPAIQESAIAPPTPQPQAAGSPPPLTRWPSVVRFALLRAVGTGLIAGLAWGSGVPYPQWAP